MNDELYHFGIKGMKWGVRRYQNKDGTLTPLGKKHLAENNIRTAENLTAKTIPAGTKMYRVTPYEKDGSPSKSKYVTYLDADRNLYKSGFDVKKYVDENDPHKEVYEHELELKTDLKIPSLDTVRRIESKLMEDETNRQEAGRAYIEASMSAWLGYTTEQIRITSKAADELNKGKNPSDVLKKLCDTYGMVEGDSYYRDAKTMQNGKDWIQKQDYIKVEQSLGKAIGVKEKLTKELQKLGYNAMYDNASIGVQNDGGYTKRQEGIEPLIVFDAKSTLEETAVNRVDFAEQSRAATKYYEWKRNTETLLRKFK